MAEDSLVEAGSAAQPPSEGTDEQATHTLHLLTPILAVGATWAVRKALNAGYRAATGRKPPIARDPDVAWKRALLWAAVTAASAAVVEVIVYRMASQAVRR